MVSSVHTLCAVLVELPGNSCPVDRTVDCALLLSSFPTHITVPWQKCVRKEERKKGKRGEKRRKGGRGEKEKGGRKKGGGEGKKGRKEREKTIDSKYKQDSDGNAN